MPKKWSFKLTPVRWVFIGLVVVAVVLALWRFIVGLGPVTNLSDEWPWGLWIGFDLLCGIALAGGGFSTAFIVHVLHKDKYLPIARAALLTSLIGYIIALVSLLLDIGRWTNFYKPFFYWGFHSVLFEVFWCISLYTTIQILEFGDIFLNRVKIAPLKRIMSKAMTPLLILGIVLPTLHQSSLGSLYLVTVDRLYPLWWSMLIPFFFVWSAFFLGPAMVTIEGMLASKAFNRKPELPIFASLTKVTMWMLIIYLIVKVVDLNYRGVYGMAFNGSFESNMFLLEMGLFVLVPIIMYAIPAIRTNLWGVVSASALVVIGVIFNRMNVVFTGMAASTGASYFPSIFEILVTLGMWSGLALAYLFVVENFPILSKEEEHEEVAAGEKFSTESSVKA